MQNRISISCDEYFRQVKATNSFKLIKQLYNDGYNLQLLTARSEYYSTEYDIYGSVLKEMFYNPNKRFWEANILAGLLTNNRVWK